MIALGAFACLVALSWGLLVGLGRAAGLPPLRCKILGHDWRVEWQRPAGSKTYSTLACRRDCPAVSYRDG